MKNTSEEKCQTPGRPYLLGTKPDGKTAILIQPNCGLWSCPYCARLRQHEWFLHALKGVTALMEKGYVVDMITLTSRGGRGRTRERSLQAFVTGWPKLAKRVKYAQKTLTYMAVPEQHKNGVVHWHVLANNTLARRWWKDSAYCCGLGYQVELSRINDAGIGAHYAAKYVGKAAGTTRWPKGFRRVRASQDWPKVEMPKVETADWQVFSDYGKAMFEVYMLRDSGVEVEIKCDPPWVVD